MIVFLTSYALLILISFLFTDWIELFPKISKNKDYNFLILFFNVTFSSVQFSCSVVSSSLRPHGLQHIRPPCPSPTPRVYSNSCPLSQWYHPTISSSVIPFSRLQPFPATGSFQKSQLVASGGQSTGVSATASVLPMDIQGWFPLGWTGWITLQSKGLSRVFSNTTVQKHQFFGMTLDVLIWRLKYVFKLWRHLFLGFFVCLFCFFCYSRNLCLFQQLRERNIWLDRTFCIPHKHINGFSNMSHLCNPRINLIWSLYIYF